MWQWIPCHLHQAYGFASRPQKPIQGCFVHIGRGEFPLCAIHSLLAYLTLRGDAPGPLFLFRDRRPLTRALLTSWLRDILSSAGIQGNFSSHSFRIGAATVAARNGIPDHQIQALGRWTSSAIYRTFELLRSRYLNCLSSCRHQLLVDSSDQIHWDLRCFTDLAQFRAG